MKPLSKVFCGHNKPQLEGFNWAEQNRGFFREIFPELITDAANDAGTPLTLMIDLDLTLCLYNPNPEDVYMEPACYNALKELIAMKLPNLRIVAITGRPISKALEMLNGLDVELIGDHGCIKLHKDGIQEIIDLPEEVGSNKDKAYSALMEILSSLTESQKKAIIVENKGICLGFKITDPNAFEKEEVKTLIANVRKKFGDFIIPEVTKVNFESPLEAELRPVKGKLQGAEFFEKWGTPKWMGSAVFFGDSMGKTGTDYEIAKAVGAYENGYVVQVGASRPNTSCAPAEDIHLSALCFAPQGLGKQLQAMLSAIRNLPLIHLGASMDTEPS